jgi:hypothetical protein
MPLRPQQGVSPLVSALSRWTAAAVLLCLSTVLSPRIAAQERVVGEPRIQPVHAVERPTQLLPASGPPGTEVTLRASLLPALTPVQVAIGGTRSGFEALTLALTDHNGELVETVTVPSWAARDRAHRFIIFNAYFSAVYAATGLFHVTDEEGRVLREGSISTSEGGCPLLHGVDNEQYALVGAVDGSLRPGTRVVVEGRLTRSEPCGEVPALEVLQLVAMEPGGEEL